MMPFPMRNESTTITLAARKAFGDMFCCHGECKSVSESVCWESGLRKYVTLFPPSLFSQENRTDSENSDHYVPATLHKR